MARSTAPRPRRRPSVPTPCTTSGCPELVTYGACDEHRKQAARTRARANPRQPSAADTAYSTTAWRNTRRKFLRDNPTCIHCGAPSEVADHEPPRAQLITAGVADPDDPAWLQPLCKSCHNRKTAKFDGGFGRPAVPIDQR